MREIKFRAKRNSKSPFIYGNCLEQDKTNNTYLLAHKDAGFFQTQWTEIDTETLGQFTGLKDKNGVEIYEGDIIKSPLGNIVEVMFGCKEHIVNVPKNEQRYIGAKQEGYQCYGWIVRNKYGNTDFMDDSFIKGEVIGNIYENKELLEEE